MSWYEIILAFGILYSVSNHCAVKAMRTFNFLIIIWYLLSNPCPCLFLILSVILSIFVNNCFIICMCDSTQFVFDKCLIDLMPVVGSQSESFFKWSLCWLVWSFCVLASVFQRQEMRSRCGRRLHSDAGWCLAVLQLVKVARVRREDGAGVHF